MAYTLNHLSQAAVEHAAAKAKLENMIRVIREEGIDGRTPSLRELADAAGLSHEQVRRILAGEHARLSVQSPTSRRRT